VVFSVFVEHRLFDLILLTNKKVFSSKHLSMFPAGYPQSCTQFPGIIAASRLPSVVHCIRPRDYSPMGDVSGTSACRASFFLWNLLAQATTH